MGHYFGWVRNYFGWVEVGGDEWRWVVMSGGEWCWVHCLIMPFFSFFVFV